MNGWPFIGDDEQIQKSKCQPFDLAPQIDISFLNPINHILSDFWDQISTSIGTTIFTPIHLNPVADSSQTGTYKIDTETMFDHSAQKSNQAYRRSKDYYKANQCHDLSVWFKSGEWYDNTVCYKCGFQGHIDVNCQSKSFETRRCYECQIKGHIARDCPMRSKRRSRAESHKMVKNSVKIEEKPKEQKVKE
uniref:Putative zinc finger, CCHC-type n=1 Tax=Helianthus annuus TaxID=4232 RepID=A0A251V619_HELAN